MNKEEILAQAKKIMDEFVSALDKVEVNEKFGSERDLQVRTPNEETDSSLEFTKRILKNAPKVKDDFFIMEKKKW